MTKGANRMIDFTTKLSTYLYQRLVLKQLPTYGKLSNTITTLHISEQTAFKIFLKV